MVIMSMAENQSIEACGIDLQNCQIVEENLGRDAEIDKDVANFGAAPNFRREMKDRTRRARSLRGG